MGTLEEMKEKAEDSLTDARNTETKKGHSFDMIAQSLTDGIKAAKDKTADAKSGMESMSEQTGENKAELQETLKTKKSDETFLASLTADCTEAREAWATRQADAKDEMGALEQVNDRKTKKDDGDDDEEPKETRTRQAVLAKLKG